ncbi:Cytidylyltransferase [Penicillium concentricum]|uniref:Cytidylyltransferase n=1 Tax=Penicillium concentricum TaxID=293559 RepID=A0A9W9S9B5_9EURO|nr:Cytidylyltransferase [Penicillium concentricum]KAJ5373349.1 Cytidylyltransferase [Penicillium concentricum]
MSSFQALRTQYASLLKRFLTSTKDFEVLTTIPPDHSAESETLYVLDSSFNPPTRAHLRIASTALLENPKPRPRLLLLLATQNADKPSKPASFEDRLVMMELFARDLRAHLASSPAFAGSGFTHGIETLPLIDIGVTKKPYFVDKAAAIEASDSYPVALEQVHLTGYDTLIRIFDSKYYPPDHTLKPLEPFLSKHRLRVTMRPSDEWGGREEQLEYVAALARGDRDGEGGRREWAERIQLVNGRASTDRPVSSTRAREALKCAPQDLDWLVPEQVRQFVLSERPYSGDSKV